MQSIIKKAQVRVAEQGASVPRVSPHAGGPCERGVRLLAEDGLVHAIEITCSCGEVAVVELEYPSDAPQTEPES